MIYKASKWMYPITISNALLGIILGALFISSSKIHIIAAIAVFAYGLVFLWGTILFSKYPVYEIKGNTLAITKMFKKNILIDLSTIDKAEEVRKSYLFLYNGDKVITGVSSAQIGSKQFIELVAAIKQVITNRSS